MNTMSKANQSYILLVMMCRDCSFKILSPLCMIMPLNCLAKSSKIRNTVQSLVRCQRSLWVSVSGLETSFSLAF